MDELDETQREHLRQSLFDYMRRHRIGAPTLGKRITDANALKPRIPLSTLQRFLARKGRTDDMYVGFFQTFAKSLPEPPADPIKILGKAMAELHGSQDPNRFVGDHTATFWHERAERREVNSDVNIVSDEGFCRVAERSTGARLAVYDGVLVCNHTTAIVQAHDRLTKTPKHYLLRGGAQRYTGCGAEAVFRSESDADLVPLSARMTAIGSLQGERIARLTGQEDSFSLLLPLEDPSPANQSKSDRPGPVRRPMSPLQRPTIPLPPTVRPPPPPPPPPSRIERVAGLFRTLVLRYKRRRDPPARKRAENTFVPLHEHILGVMSDPITQLTVLSGGLQPAFLEAADQADERKVHELVDAGANINATDPRTGLTALHLAVGRGSIGMARFLIERGAKFVPDKLGRMPSLVAAECEAGEELCDYIVEAEAAADSGD